MVRCRTEEIGSREVFQGVSVESGDEKELEPASQVRYHVRSGVERANSEMKDNYGANHVRVKGHLKVLCHLMFGVLVLTAKQIFNYFA